MPPIGRDERCAFWEVWLDALLWFLGSSQVNYNSRRAVQLLAQAEKPFLFGGKRREVAATPFGGCSALGINARACPEPILEPR